MTKDEIRTAINNLDYDYLIQHEDDEIRKSKLKDLYFHAMSERKKLKEIDNLEDRAYSRALNEYWKKEIREYKKNVRK